jgi:glutaminyl-peptide cyclotransferase
LRKLKNIGIVLLVIAILGFVLSSLFNERAPVRALKYSDIIESPTYNAIIPWGNLIEINLFNDKVSKYDSITVRFVNQKVKVNKEYSINLNTKDLTLGTKMGTVNLWKDGKPTVIDFSIVVVSEFTPPVSNITKLKKINKDPNSFTQGFEVYKGVLYESGGQYGESLLRKLNPTTGKTIKTLTLDKKYFAEGISIMYDKIYLLTWKEREILIFDLDFNLVDKKPLITSTGEGWGICNDGRSLIISDGSNKLTYINPISFEVENVIEVYRGQEPALALNELEYANDLIYANVWNSTQIMVIEPKSGRVIKVAELNFLKSENNEGDVLNGIAYLQDSKTFLVTGKYWKHMYEIKM